MKLVKSNDVAWAPALTQGKYAQHRKPLVSAGIGASLWKLAPGKKSFPFHSHHVTEEALFVVSGTAKVRTPEGLTAIGPGDYVSFEPGGGAHQLINDGAEELVYLGLSAGKGFDIVEYPDTGKIAAALGAPPSGQRFIFKKDQQTGYFDGDPDAT
jgi:uncharacterized cupin superfamily protein